MTPRVDDRQRARKDIAGLRRRCAFNLDFKRESGRDAGDKGGMAEQKKRRQVARLTHDIGHERELRPNA